MNKIYFISFFAFASFLLFKKNDIKTFVYEDSSYGIIAEDYILPQTTVNVCWAQMTDLKQIAPDDMILALGKEKEHEIIDKNLKNEIQKKIQQQFTLEKVGVEFVGWNDCVNDSKPHIRIFAFNKLSQKHFSYPAGRCYIGQAYYIYSTEKEKFILAKRPSHIPGFLFLNKPWMSKDLNANFKAMVLRTALHEFGHATGLHHEHYRPQAAEDRNCWSFKEEDPQFNQAHLGKAVAYSDYDPDSIMNYCFMSKEDNQKVQKIEDIKLSPLDIHTLRCVYKKGAQSEKACRRREI